VIDNSHNPDDSSARAENRPTSKRFPRSLFGLLRIAIAAGLLGFLFASIGWQPVALSFSKVLWWWVVAGSLAYLLGLFLVTARWKILLMAQGIYLPTGVLFKRYWMTRFFSNFLPGRTGGDLFRIFGPWGIPLRKTAITSSVLFDRFTGLLGLLVLLFLVGMAEYGMVRELLVGFVPIISVLGVAILLLLLAILGALGRVRQFITRWPHSKFRLVMDEFLDSLQVYLNSKGTILGAVIISVAFHLVSALATYYALRALGLDIPLGSVLFVSMVVNIVSLAPISINGWGLREGGFVLLLTQTGADNAEVLAAVLLDRVIRVMLSSVGGILYMTDR